jgi:5,10-methylenetetrahydromethanopterin reductase
LATTTPWRPPSAGWRRRSACVDLDTGCRPRLVEPTRRRRRSRGGVLRVPRRRSTHRTTSPSPTHGLRPRLVYDTPQQSPDVWMTLALAAERTERIGLGPGVLVPSLRHPMVNAAATATLVALAPAGSRSSFGTGFTGRRAMGYRAIPWSFMKEYLLAYRGLLRGEVVEWEGARMQMLHPDGHAPRGPSTCPSSSARSARRATRWPASSGRPLHHPAAPGFRRRLLVGALPGVGHRAGRGRGHRLRPRPVAGGPGWALAYHGAYEFGGPDAVRDLPGGGAWMDVVERAPADQRHLAVHVGHCVALNEADRAAWDAGGHAMLRDVTLSGTARRDPRRDRRARRARRHRDRVPAVRARRGGRARTVPVRRNEGSTS